MINLIIFGPPGSGKGTQAAKLVKKYKLVHISTGDLFRYNLKNDTALGKEARKYMDKGELVPDRVTIKMLEAKVVESTKAKGFIFDGFPRTIRQSRALDKFLKSRGEEVSKLIMLDVPREELKKRLMERGKTSGRADDTKPSIIKNRLDVYEDTTFPVFKFYVKAEKSIKVWGVGSLDIIFKRLCLEIDDIPKRKVKAKKASTVSSKSKAKPKAKATKKVAKKKKATKSPVVKKTKARSTTARTKSGSKRTSSKKRIPKG